jgi:hypothetical protein
MAPMYGSSTRSGVVVVGGGGGGVGFGVVVVVVVAGVGFGGAVHGLHCGPCFCPEMQFSTLVQKYEIHDNLIMSSTLYLLRHQCFVVKCTSLWYITMYVRGQVAPSMLSS